MKIKKTVRNAAISGLAALLLSTSGCGTISKTIEQDFNYKTLVGKTGHLTLYSGNGQAIKDFPSAKIIYSASDSRTIWYQIGKDQQYWMGDALFDIDE